MTNCYFIEETNETACGTYGGVLARSVSVDHWDNVSCPDCLTQKPRMGRKRCMIYACNHQWSFIPDPGGYVGHYCTRCDDHWDFDYCDHDPTIPGCECAR